MTPPMTATARKLLEAASGEIRRLDDWGNQRQPHQVGYEVLQKQRAQAKIANRAEDTLAAAIGLAEALEGRDCNHLPAGYGGGKNCKRCAALAAFNALFKEEGCPGTN